MFNLSKKVISAIEAVVYIAYNSSGEPVRSSEITNRQGTPQRYLEQTLQVLVKANILVGVRGPKGGYILAKERRRITLGEIVTIINNSEKLETSMPSISSDLCKKVIAPVWDDLNLIIMEKLNKVSVEDLCSQANNLNIQRNLNSNLDFNI